MALRILLSNLHSSHNVGDAALTQLALQELRDNFPGCEILLVMDEPQTYPGPEPVYESTFSWFKDRETQQFLWANVPGLVAGSVLAAVLYRLTGRSALWLVPPARRAMVKAYFMADLVVSSPGGFLYSSKSGLGLINSLFSLAYAELAGKPLYLLAQSIGPFKLKWQYPIIRWVLGWARLIIVREALSWQQLRDIGLQHPACYILPDLAFLLTKTNSTDIRAKALAWLADWGVYPETERPLMGVTLVNWGAQDPEFKQQAHYEATMAEVLNSFLTKHGGKVVLFPQVYGSLPGADDRIPAQRVAEQLKAWGKQVVLISDPQTYPVTKAAYGYMDLVLGTRMHSNIFAITEGVPVLAIGYQPKTLGIAQMVGLEQWVIDITQVNATALWERLDALWSERAAVRAHLKARVPVLAQQAAQAVQFIAQDFANWQATHPPK